MPQQFCRHQGAMLGEGMGLVLAVTVATWL